MNPTAAAPTQNEAVTRQVLESLPEGILIVDDRGAIEYANTAAANLFGVPVSALPGRAFAALLAEPFQAQYAVGLREFAAGAAPAMFAERREVVGQRGDGATVPVELTLTEMHEAGTRLLVALARDIGEQKRAEARLLHLAEHDTLTGLVNRQSFEALLTRHVEYSARYGNPGSVIALGVDNFKYVNDSLGHEAGDELLRTAASLIMGRLRKTDVMARLSGDVFGVLIHGAGAAKAEEVAEELLGIVRNHAFALNRQSVKVTLSAGITALEERPVTGVELLAEADVAMYAAKKAGRDRVVAFKPEGHEGAEMKHAWSERVRQATERGLFVLVCQPIMHVASGQPAQYELLLRMRGEDGGLVEPSAFLATAERFGLIQGVDRWVTQQAMRLIAAHRKEGRDLILEVNLSGKTMAESNFPTEVKKELAATGINPANIIFEVTETAAVSDIQLARRFAQNLTELGCRFALDDFGSGYASFYYLKHLPISYLKIDGEFVKELPNSPTDQLIVKAMVDVCRGMGIGTIAEFVGSQETLNLLGSFGVDFAQGYFIGKPQPVAELRSAAAQPAG